LFLLWVYRWEQKNLSEVWDIAHIHSLPVQFHCYLDDSE
jgi:hypothetical protein